MGVVKLELGQIQKLVKADVVWGRHLLDVDIREACAADLMSDVLAFSLGSGSILLTGLTNPQVMRTAEMVDVSAIMFVRGKVPPEPTVSIAQQLNIPLLVTDFTLFDACGLLHSAGLVSARLKR